MAVKFWLCLRVVGFENVKDGRTAVGTAKQRWRSIFKDEAYIPFILVKLFFPKHFVKLNLFNKPMWPSPYMRVMVYSRVLITVQSRCITLKSMAEITWTVSAFLRNRFAFR